MNGRFPARLDTCHCLGAGLEVTESSLGERLLWGKSASSSLHCFAHLSSLSSCSIFSFYSSSGVINISLEESGIDFGRYEQQTKLLGVEPKQIELLQKRSLALFQLQDPLHGSAKYNFYAGSGIDGHQLLCVPFFIWTKKWALLKLLFLYVDYYYYL